MTLVPKATHETQVRVCEIALSICQVHYVCQGIVIIRFNYSPPPPP